MKIKCNCDEHRAQRICDRREKHPSRPKHGRKARRGEKPWLDAILQYMREGEQAE